MNASPQELQTVVGKSPWKVWKGIGSFLLFEFGRRRRIDGLEPCGTYTLWIYMADWRIRGPRRELAHSESSDKTIERAARALTGRKLEGIVLNTLVLRHPLRYGATLHFQGGYTLRAMMYDRDQIDAIFMLLSPKNCVSYLSDGSITTEPAKH